MDEIVRRVVECAIATMEEELGERLTIDAVAHSASCIFPGGSPGPRGTASKAT